MVLVQWQFIFNGTYSWAWQKQWYLISALTKTMVHNHGYYGTKSWLVWVLISASMVPVQWQFIFNGTYSWAWQKQWYLISALTKTMVHNHGYYGTKSWLVWVLISASMVPVQWQFIFNGTYSWAWQNQWYLIMATMVLNLLWILIMAPAYRGRSIQKNPA